MISQTNGVEIIRDDFFSHLSSDQEKIEKHCDIFANEFLVPLDDFEIELKKKELDELFEKRYNEHLKLLESKKNNDER